ncbi:MAG: putative SnoaL-like aldol condensation-catalyzing enzyme [Flavobacteriaceae bacterium]|jgi:predicted SnoaL-like aldol condensation-catalyzing enzyme
MSKSPKQVIKEFHQANIISDETVLENYFHKDLVLIWNSADGLSIMNYEDLIAFFLEIRRTYNDLRIEISHLLQDGNHVTIRYKYYVSTLENPEEELGISHFIGIWEVKDNKMYRGHLVSQPVTENDDTTESYHKVKV